MNIERATSNVESKDDFRYLAFIYLVKNGTLAPAPSGNDIEKMLQKCMREWEKPQFKTYDFKMVVYCIKQQLKYLK